MLGADLGQCPSVRRVLPIALLQFALTGAESLVVLRALRVAVLNARLRSLREAAILQGTC